jgi:Protein of unknown function (DUF3105)
VRRVAWIGAGVLAVAAVTAVVVVLSSGDASVAGTMRAAGCTYTDAAPYPPKDAATLADYHADVPTLASKVRWKTFPPSGGSHYRLWATWGFYTRPVNPRMVVHNEEHGGVVLWWGPAVPPATVAELRRFYESEPVAVFGTPIAGLGDRVAISAWTADPAYKGDAGLAYRNGSFGIGRLAVCSRFDEHAFTVFRDAYRGHSPQDFPLAGDAPGCGPTRSCP